MINKASTENLTMWAAYLRAWAGMNGESYETWRDCNITICNGEHHSPSLVILELRGSPPKGSMLVDLAYPENVTIWRGPIHVPQCRRRVEMTRISTVWREANTRMRDPHWGTERDKEIKMHMLKVLSKIHLSSEPLSMYVMNKAEAGK